MKALRYSPPPPTTSPRRERPRMTPPPPAPSPPRRSRTPYLVLGALTVLLLSQLPALLAYFHPRERLTWQAGRLRLSFDYGWPELTARIDPDVVILPYLRRRWRASLLLTRVGIEGNHLLDLPDIQDLAYSGSSAPLPLAAVDYLGYVRDDTSVAKLAAVAGAVDPRLRERAVSALGRIANPRGAGAVIRLLDDADVGVLEQALRAAGRLRLCEAVPRLLAHTRAESPQLRAAAAFALGQVRDGTARLLDLRWDESPLVLLEVGRALLPVHESAALFALRRASWANTPAAAEAIALQVELGNEAAERAVREGLAHPLSTVRVAAARLLLQHPAFRTDHAALQLPVSISRQCLAIPPADPAYMLVQAVLARSGDPQAYGALLANATALLSERVTAGEALGYLGDPLALKMAGDLAEDSRVRFHAAYALLDRSWPSCDEAMALIAMRLDDDPRAAATIRLRACEALGRLGSREALPALAQALQDEAWEVRVAAAGAIGAILQQPWEPKVSSVAKAAAVAAQ